MWEALLALVAVFSLALAEESFPKDVVSVPVECEVEAGTLFECEAKWNEATGADVWGKDDKEGERLERINQFFELVTARKDVQEFLHDSSAKDFHDYIFEGYQGTELFASAQKFFGLEGNDTMFTKANFLAVSYYLDYCSNNTFTVSMPEGHSPVVGFAGGLYAPPVADSNESYYDNNFMEALRGITVQYVIRINLPDKTQSDPYYAIGYMGTFSLPYFFSAVQNDYIDKFSAAYNIERSWATDNGGTFKMFTDLFEVNARTIPPGIFMVNFVAPGYKEVNTKDPKGELVRIHQMEEDEIKNTCWAPIDFERFRYMFALRYGIRTSGQKSFLHNMFAYSADDIDPDERYDPLKEASWNYCRNLGRNNIADKNVEDPESNHGYDYIEPSEDSNIATIECNHQNLPSFFFMTHNLDNNYPFLFSTKYQLMVDATCQYRTSLDSKGMPKTQETNVKFGQDYGYDWCNPEEEEEEQDIKEGKCWKSKFATGSGVDGLESKTSFVLNGNDFFGLHVVQDRDQYSTYEEEGVPTSYYYYELNNDNIDKLYYDSDSFCNTAVSDTYVLYDMKEYASVYGALTAITSSSFGYESVYSSMKAYPTKSNYTAVITAAQVDSDDASKVNVKTQLQKCVNVFLDTQGLDIAACNDVTSTWDWGVFGGSLAGLIVVVGLWVWGGMYNKKFNQHNPPYYTDLLNYEPEWRRLEEIARREREQRRAARRGEPAREPMPVEESSGTERLSE